MVDGDPALSWVEGVVGELDAAPDVRVMPRATALGVYDMGYVVVYERSRPVERVWHVRAGRVILATGAHERPIAFADDDRPGVMLASAAALYADRFGVLPGARAVVFTTSHTGHRAALRARGRGAGGRGRHRCRRGRSGHRRDAGTRHRRALGVVGDRHGRRPAGQRRARHGSRRCHRILRCRSAPRGGRLEPGGPAVARHQRWSPIRRVARLLPPRRRRAGLAADRGRRRRGGPSLRHATMVHPRRRSQPAFRRPPTRLHGRGRARGRRDEPALHRAREAGDVHRHRHRSGTHERRTDRRDREPGVGCGTGRAGTHERPSAVHARPVRRARGT